VGFGRTDPLAIDVARKKGGGFGVASSRERAVARLPAPSRKDMVFCDQLSLSLQKDLDRMAPSQATVLIYGETGTGKELVARYLHSRSRRSDATFMAVNCGALSDTLAEADLFGWEKGAFTGADRAQAGWFSCANGGTLFLDEIGDLPMHLQVKLLRVLQEREVVPLGSRKAIPIDVRVIAATNVDLQEAIEQRRFREDLYFRLNVASVTLAPLRERPGDIEPLALHFLAIYRERLNRPELSFSHQALAWLCRHSWPGNIRELDNAVQNTVLLAKGPVIEPTDLRLSLPKRARALDAPDLEARVRALVERAIMDGESEIFERVTSIMVRTAYDLANGNQVRAAEGLGISRNAYRTQLAHVGTIQPRRRAAVTTPTKAEHDKRTACEPLGVNGHKFKARSRNEAVFNPPTS